MKTPYYEHVDTQFSQLTWYEVWNCLNKQIQSELRQEVWKTFGSSSRVQLSQQISSQLKEEIQ